MTVLAAEAGAGAAEAGAAEAGAGGRAALSGRQRQASQDRIRRAQDRGQQAQNRGRQALGAAAAAAPKGSYTSHQSVILAEFVAAALLVAATPFAKKDSPGISPYAASDMVQLVAVGLVYFILALISGTNPRAGRFAAWFGALILLTVGLGEAARLAKLLNVFGLESAPGQQLGQTAGGGPEGQAA